MSLAHDPFPRFCDWLENLHGFDQVINRGVGAVGERICVDPAEPEGQHIFTSEESVGDRNTPPQKRLSIGILICLAECYC